MEIAILKTADPRYGGSRYESMAASALSVDHNVTYYNAMPWVARGHRPQSLLRIWNTERRARADVWIRNEIALCGMTKDRDAQQIGIIHHLHRPAANLDIWNRSLERRILANAGRCNQVVVVSQYWQDRLAELGLRNTILIHNAFDVKRFARDEERIRAFKSTNDLSSKPLVYIGNCQRLKGAEQVWTALKDKGYELVASGVSDMNLPIRSFTLSYDDYILLLSACEAVVTMSQFAEGWNRTAHEALLCRTPVIGSGAGGMGELLRNAGQLVCECAADLPDLVADAISRRKELGRNGYEFASKFTTDRFGKQWRRLIAEL